MKALPTAIIWFYLIYEMNTKDYKSVSLVEKKIQTGIEVSRLDLIYRLLIDLARTSPVETNGHE